MMSKSLHRFCVERNGPSMLRFTTENTLPGNRSGGGGTGERHWAAGIRYAANPANPAKTPVGEVPVVQARSEQPPGLTWR